MLKDKDTDAVRDKLLQPFHRKTELRGEAVGEASSRTST